MTEDRADWHLQNWAAWQRGEQSNFLDIKIMSLESSYTRSTDFDEMFASTAMDWARITDTVVHDLLTAQKEAVFAHYLNGAWKHAAPLGEIIVHARVAVAARLESKNVV